MMKILSKNSEIMRKGQTMNNLQVLGKFLDQPVLVSKFEKKGLVYQKKLI